MTKFLFLQKKHKEFIKNNKLILKTQQRFKSERHNVSTEEVNQSIDSIETYAYGTRKDLESKKEQIKCNNIVKLYKK